MISSAVIMTPNTDNASSPSPGAAYLIGSAVIGMISRRESAERRFPPANRTSAGAGVFPAPFSRRAARPADHPAAAPSIVPSAVARGSAERRTARMRRKGSPVPSDEMEAWSSLSRDWKGWK